MQLGYTALENDCYYIFAGFYAFYYTKSTCFGIYDSRSERLVLNSGISDETKNEATKLFRNLKNHYNVNISPKDFQEILDNVEITIGGL